MKSQNNVDSKNLLLLKFQKGRWTSFCRTSGDCFRNTTTDNFPAMFLFLTFSDLIDTI